MQCLQGHASFNQYRAVECIDGIHTPHALQRYHDVITTGYSSANESGEAAVGDYTLAVLVTQLQHSGNFAGVGRPDNRFCLAPPQWWPGVRAGAYICATQHASIAHNSTDAFQQGFHCFKTAFKSSISA
jgi:hypothetical protein